MVRISMRVYTRISILLSNNKVPFLPFNFGQHHPLIVQPVMELELNLGDSDICSIFLGITTQAWTFLKEY